MITSIKTFFHDLWVKIKTNVMNAVALIGTALGSLMSHIDAIAAAMGDPNLNQQLATVIGDAKAFGRWMLAVGIVATIAKFKALVQSPPKA